jgi:hypothetical protein
MPGSRVTVRGTERSLEPDDDPGIQSGPRIKPSAVRLSIAVIRRDASAAATSEGIRRVETLTEG